jgi:predicted nuclease of predicted toxin-antitoxin system
VELLLREMGYYTVAVRDINPHMPDVEVLALARQHTAIVVTMDKDFGDLVFKEQLPHHGVLLLRLEEATGPERAAILRLILGQHAAELPGRFAVFQHDRLRISG